MQEDCTPRMKERSTSVTPLRTVSLRRAARDCDRYEGVELHTWDEAAVQRTAMLSKQNGSQWCNGCEPLLHPSFGKMEIGAESVGNIRRVPAHDLLDRTAWLCSRPGVGVSELTRV